MADGILNVALLSVIAIATFLVINAAAKRLTP